LLTAPAGAARKERTASFPKKFRGELKENFLFLFVAEILMNFCFCFKNFIFSMFFGNVR